MAGIDLKVGQIVEVTGDDIITNVNGTCETVKSCPNTGMHDGKYVINGITYCGKWTYHTGYGTSVAVDWWCVSAQSVDNEETFISFTYP